MYLENIVLLARDVIYTSRAYATMSVSVCLSVCLSVTEVHWRTIANLCFKFRSKFTAHCRRGEGSSQQHLALCQPLLGPIVCILQHKNIGECSINVVTCITRDSVYNEVVTLATAWASKERASRKSQCRPIRPLSAPALLLKVMDRSS